MTDRPILFSAPMVRALLDGRKTQTRRIIKPQPPTTEAVRNISGANYSWMPPERGLPWRVAGPVWAVRQIMGAEPSLGVRVAKGDRLWVRETWRTADEYHSVKPAELPASDRRVQYEAGPWQAWDIGGTPGRLRPGIHMPRWVSRLTLTVTDVRVQRLQEISEADAIAEGIERVGGGRHWLGCSGTIPSASPVEAYSRLWDKINGEGAWRANPWVTATTFTVALRNIDA